ncbi:hypothetical protein BGZ63DRAFT_383791 [Mariannaea sp. PMI_226]|nr:hypothetical protein BGZ63DRAFT_383791 [Mariannaea sp. PMI_226]
MAYYDQPDGQSYYAREQYNLHNTAPNSRPAMPPQPLNHRVSALTVSDYADGQPTRYDPLGSQNALRGRESMVSLDSHSGHGSPDPGNNGYDYPSGGPTWSGSFGYSSGAGATYTPVTGQNSKRSYSSLRQPVETIDEEDYDLSLLQNAVPMGKKSQYAPIAEEEDDDDFTPGFDVSSALGPTTAQDDVFMKKLQEKEASGQLTGGLGIGFQPEARVRDADLLPTPSYLQRSISKSFTSRLAGRMKTIRNRGQDEANRRGEVIEVVMEEPTGMDLSSMEGPSTIQVDEARRSTFLAKEKTTEIFYPQPNWKPFSMQWPYLTFLVLLSLVMGVIQELLFQKFKHNPVVRFKSPDDISPAVYFMVKFLPTLCAVTFGVFWQFTDFEVRRLEAYYQLSKPDGALASKSINVDYVTSIGIFRPIHALRLGHYAVFLSSIASTLAISLVPTFAAASVVMKPNRAERLAHPGGYKEIYIAAVWSRLLTATLCVCAVLGICLFWVLQRRRSGLQGDVRGIGGLASMAVVAHILMDFKDMDTAKHKDIHNKLKRHRYMLRNSSLAPYDGKTSSLQDSESDDTAHLSENPHPLMLRAAGSIPFIIGLVLFAAFIPAFLFTPASIVTDKAPFVVTALAVILKMCWAAMETAVRVMEPYYILSKRHAPSKTLILDYTALPILYMPIRALLNGHILVFMVGFGTVMAEFLTIMVTSLATVEGQDFVIGFGFFTGEDESSEEKHRLDSGQETLVSFYVSLCLTLFVLLYMTIVATTVFVRRRHPFLPRQPNTISSILAFIHQSKMLYTFVGTAKMTNTEKGKKLDDGKTYGLGWFRGRDGQTHCGIDEEELTSSYKHGATGHTDPWSTQWDTL